MTPMGAWIDYGNAVAVVAFAVGCICRVRGQVEELVGTREVLVLVFVGGVVVGFAVDVVVAVFVGDREVDLGAFWQAKRVD